MHDVIGAVINIVINMEHNGTLLNNGQLVCVCAVARVVVFLWQDFTNLIFIN